MNWRMLSTMQFREIKTSPPARRFDNGGRELDLPEETWIVQEVVRDRIILRSSRTHESVTMGTDHIREYITDLLGKTDGFLRLKSQILMEPSGIAVEPLDDRGTLFHRPTKIPGASLDEIDEALRVAKGTVIYGQSPLHELNETTSLGISIDPFSAYMEPEKRRVFYNSGSIIALAAHTTYYVYAIDPDRRGGAVTYMCTTIRHLALAGNEKIYIGRKRVTSVRKP